MPQETDRRHVRVLRIRFADHRKYGSGERVRKDGFTGRVRFGSQGRYAKAHSEVMPQYVVGNAGSNNTERGEAARHVVEA